MLDLSQEKITTDPVYRVLAIISLPLLVQNLVRVLQGVIDIFWVGRLGGDAVAAVGLMYPIAGTLLVFAIGVPFIGTQVLVSQRAGADNEFGARKAAFNGLVFAATLGLLFGGGAYVVAPSMMGLMTSMTPGSSAGRVVEMATSYFRILSLGVVFAAMSDAIEAAFVARGDSRAAFYSNAATAATNVVVDPILIFGVGPVPALGIEGAALATVFGYFAGMVLGLIFVVQGRSGGILSRTAAQIELGEFWEIGEIGLPPAAQRANRRVVATLLVLIVFAAGGAAALTAYIVGTRISRIATVPATGLQSATQSVVGQNLGANKPDRADRTTKVGLAFIGVALTAISVLQWSMAGAITNVIAPGLEAETFELSVKFLHILAFSYPAFGVMYVLQGGFNGARRSKVSFYSSVFQSWVIQLPLAAAGGVLLSNNVLVVFWAYTVAHVVAAIGLAVYYYYATRSGMFRNASDEVERGTAAD